MFGVQEWLLIGVLAIILIFGARKFGDIGTGLGEGIKNFKKSVKGDDPRSGDGKPQTPSNP